MPQLSIFVLRKRCHTLRHVLVLDRYRMYARGHQIFVYTIPSLSFFLPLPSIMVDCYLTVHNTYSVSFQTHARILPTILRAIATIAFFFPLLLAMRSKVSRKAESCLIARQAISVSTYRRRPLPCLLMFPRRTFSPEEYSPGVNPRGCILEIQGRFPR
jgi:hypothetical protein